MAAKRRVCIKRRNASIRYAHRLAEPAEPTDDERTAWRRRPLPSLPLGRCKTIYYRTQAQLFARLAVATSDPRISARYSQMALEHLAKADEVQPQATQSGPAAVDHDNGTNMDRD
jgi:hypothetical protein